MPQLEVGAKVTWCIHIGHCCDWASLTTLCPKCWTCYVWMKSMLKLDYTRGQSICLVLYRQTEICFTSALNHLDTPNWCKVSVILKAPCMALAELWLGAGVEQGQFWAALLLWWAPCHTLRRVKLSRGMVNPNLCSVFHRDTLSAVVFQSSCWHPWLFSLHMKCWPWGLLQCPQTL